LPADSEPRAQRQAPRHPPTDPDPRVRAQQQHQSGHRDRHPARPGWNDDQGVVGGRIAMRGTCAMLLLAGSAGLAACTENPAEVRRETPEVPVTATWTATAASIPPSTVTGALAIQQ